jgi:hypothetical protein
MLGDRSRLLRLALLAMTVFAAVSWPTKHYRLHAATTTGDDDDDSGGGGGGGGDDDSSKGDDSGGGGDDDDDTADADQPPVTAGGLFTKATYPQSAVLRPLTLIEGMTEIRLGGTADLQSGDTFGKFGADIYGRYGVRDNLEVRADLGLDLNNFTSADVGVEGALNYDPFAVDFRGTLLIAKAGGETHVGANLGFPIRYQLAPTIAITAIESLLTINFNAKPDFSPSIGVIASPVPIVALIARAQIIDAGFEPHKANLDARVTVGAQITPMNKVDIGLAGILTNLINPAPAADGSAGSPIDARELELYLNLRF